LPRVLSTAPAISCENAFGARRRPLALGYTVENLPKRRGERDQR
jgi:hypothetical protein